MTWSFEVAETDSENYPQYPSVGDLTGLTGRDDAVVFFSLMFSLSLSFSPRRV